ncbi:hypothetical protein AWV79_06060 [Cupriavidus sp. UYMMa02A]|nr:hypothetical protein AWV79_06060 [Cupriavidus sp. UYMMa02A]
MQFTALGSALHLETAKYGVAAPGDNAGAVGKDRRGYASPTEHLHGTRACWLAVKTKHLVLQRSNDAAIEPRELFQADPRSRRFQQPAID